MTQALTSAVATAIGRFASLAAIALAFGAAASAEDGKVPAPPYQVHVSDYLVVGVVWNEATVRKLLPAGLKPSADMSGGIALYKSDRGFGISPYDSVYAFVNVEGHDAGPGVKGRWMLQGGYGPDDKVAAAIRSTYGWPVRAATVTITETVQGKRAVAQIGGRDVFEIELKTTAVPCDWVAGINHYVGGSAGRLNVNQIPFQGQWCGGEPIKVANVAPVDDPMAVLVPAKVVWGGLFRDGAIAFTKPIAKP